MFLFRDKRLPLKRELRCSLQSIWGMGKRKAYWVAAKIGFAFPFYINNLNFYNFFLITSVLKRLLLSEIRVKRVMSSNIKSLINMKAYKGFRHFSFLPVRGQRTRTNAGTLRFLRSHKERVVWK